MRETKVGAAVPAAAAVPLGTCREDGLTTFLHVRRRLFSIAYRMLRSVAEAEDLLQEVWIRWQITDRARVRHPVAFLVAATTRLAINVRHSARARREACAGSSVSELVDTSPQPHLQAERAEALDRAVRLMLEKLLPTERAAFVLREGFNYHYREIADVLDIEEANARQIVTRARQQVSGRRHALVSQADQRRLLGTLVAAARTGDLPNLEDLLAASRGDFR